MQVFEHEVDVKDAKERCHYLMYCSCQTTIINEDVLPYLLLSHESKPSHLKSSKHINTREEIYMSSLFTSRTELFIRVIHIHQSHTTAHRTYSSTKKKRYPNTKPLKQKQRKPTKKQDQMQKIFLRTQYNANNNKCPSTPATSRLNKQ